MPCVTFVVCHMSI